MYEPAILYLNLVYYDAGERMIPISSDSKNSIFEILKSYEVKALLYKDGSIERHVRYNHAFKLK